MRIVRLLVLFAATLTLSSQLSAQDNIVTREGISILSGRTMGPVAWNVSVANCTEPEKLHTAIQTRLDEINSRMSTWLADSEISRFNAQQTTDWFPISADTKRVVSEALSIAQKTSGAFDPTVGPLIALWNFDANPGTFEIPSKEKIAAAQNVVGYKNLETRAQPPALRKKIGGVTINLSAIAKGYAVDAIAELLRKKSQPDFLVEIGGEVISAGSKPDGIPWRVGIERPVAGERALYSIVVTFDRALATSGDYRNFFEVDGQRYSHTIDPTTGRPVKHSLASVSVIAKTCMQADGFATALMVMGKEDGLKFVKQQDGIDAFFIQREADESESAGAAAFTTAQSDNFPTHSLVGAPTATARAAAKTAKTNSTRSKLITLAAAFGIFVVAIGGMAIGVIISNRRIKGSCGGLANLPGHDVKSVCDLCATPAEECEDFRKAIAAAAADKESNA